MNSHIFPTLTQLNIWDPFNNIKQFTIQYVDNSTNMVSSNNPNRLQIYINRLFVILEKYYNIDKLTLNEDKTKFMVVCRSNLRQNISNMTLMTNNYVIEQSSKVKILGIFFSAGLSQIAMYNNIISKKSQ